eukprot:3895932-Rhodomonas_salina.2
MHSQYRSSHGGCRRGACRRKGREGGREGERERGIQSRWTRDSEVRISALRLQEGAEILSCTPPTSSALSTVMTSFRSGPRHENETPLPQMRCLRELKTPTARVGQTST